MSGFRTEMNKHIVTIVIVAVVTVGALGFILLLLSGNQERNAVPIDPSAEEASSSATAKDPKIEANVSEAARDLFLAKVDTIDDQGKVAKLLEVMGIRKEIGVYKVELKTKEPPKYMIIKFEKPVNEGAVQQFDTEMKKYAQQILALVADAEEVHWSYNIKSADGKEKVNIVRFGAEMKTEEVQEDIKTFGESASKVDELLFLQKGI